MPDMAPEWLEKLLVLQDRDAHRGLVETQLSAIPREREAAERKITQHKAVIEQAHGRVRDLDLERSRLEQEIAARERLLAEQRRPRNRPASIAISRYRLRKTTNTRL